MSSVEISPVAPSGMILQKMTSTAKHILKNVRYHRIPADSNVNYSYSGNNRISFTIASTDSFWDPSESFLQFEYTTTSNQLNEFQGVEAANYQKKRGGSWSKGGLHSAIRAVTIETASGVLIEHINSYNRLYGILSNATESRDYVNLCGGRYHDSTEQHFTHDGLNYDDLVALNCQLAAAPRNTDTDAATANAYVPLLTYRNFTSGVDNTLANTKIGNPKYRSSRNLASVAASNPQQVALKLQTGFLNLSFIPLQYIRQGIRIHIDLENPNICLVFPKRDVVADEEKAKAAGDTMNYTIVNPVFMCRFIMPDASIKSQYDKALMNGSLNYEFESFGYSSYQTNGGAGVTQYTIPVSKRSVKNVFVVAQNLRANSQNATTDNANSSTYDMNTFIRARISSYRFQHASDYYPSLPIAIANGGSSGVSNSSALEALSMCFGKSTSLYDKFRFQPNEWNTQSTDSGNANECTALIMSYPLGRDMGSEFTGLDTSNSNQLIAEITFEAQYTISGGNQNVWLHNFIQYNNIFSVTPNGVVIRN